MADNAGRPQRIQLRRTKGWRKPEDAVVVTRPGRWGNPVVIDGWVSVGVGWETGGRCGAFTFVRTRRDAVRFFTMGLRRGGVVIGDSRGGNRRPVALPSHDEIRAALAGCDLACWCPLSEPCHADVLLRVAAGEDS